MGTCVDVSTIGGAVSFDGVDINGFIGVSNWDSGTATQIATHCATATESSYIPGRREPGTAGIDINYDPSDSSHVSLETKAAAGTVGDLVYTASNGSTITQEAFIQNFPFNAADDSIMKGTVTFKLSGARVVA